MNVAYQAFNRVYILRIISKIDTRALLLSSPLASRERGQPRETSLPVRRPDLIPRVLPRTTHTTSHVSIRSERHRVERRDRRAHRLAPTVAFSNPVSV